MTFERLINTATDLPWVPAGTVVQLIASTRLPPQELLTSVHIFCFHKDKLLLVRHKTRGWDIPGGHVEPGEALDVALRRELLEEASATTSDLSPFAYFKICLSAPKPSGYKYPYPESYVSCFVGSLSELREFGGDFETIERRLFTPEEIRVLDWYQSHSKIFEFALEHISGVSR